MKHFRERSVPTLACGTVLLVVGLTTITVTGLSSETNSGYVLPTKGVANSPVRAQCNARVPADQLVRPATACPR